MLFFFCGGGGLVRVFRFVRLLCVLEFEGLGPSGSRRSLKQYHTDSWVRTSCYRISDIWSCAPGYTIYVRLRLAALVAEMFGGCLRFPRSDCAMSPVSRGHDAEDPDVQARDDRP